MKSLAADMKRIFVLLLTICFTACLTACGEAAPMVSMYDLQKKMLAAAGKLPEMSSVSSASEDADVLFRYLSDFDYGKVEGFFLAYSASGSAEEIAVVAVQDTADLADCRASLKAHMESRILLYKNYEPSEVSRVEDGLLFTEGRYAVMIICDGQEDVKTAFSDFVKSGK